MNNRRLVLLLSWMAIILASPSTHAARYDMNLGKYWTVCADQTDVSACANQLFHDLINELGEITAPAFLSPAETLGLNGFEFAFEGTVVPIHNDKQFWTAAIEGSPGSVLFIPHLHVRKGLPFSFEVGTQLSYIPESEMFVVGAELKWALNEGFYFIPDLAIRFAINHMVGPKDFALSTGGWDLSLSKAFGVGGMISLTPYAGYNMLFVHGSSHVVLDQADPPLTHVFNEVNWKDNLHHRFFVGCRLKSFIFQVVAEGTFTTDGIYGFNFKLGFDF